MDRFDNRMQGCRCRAVPNKTRVRILDNGYADFCTSCGHILPGSFIAFQNYGLLWDTDSEKGYVKLGLSRIRKKR